MHVKIGDLVWAKLGRYPPWPGLITEPPSTLEKSKPKITANKLCVYFFGSKNFSWVPLNNIKPYSKSKDNNVNEKRHLSKYKSKALQKAVLEIEKYIQDNNNSSSGKQSGSYIATSSATDIDDADAFSNADKAKTSDTVKTHSDQPHLSDVTIRYSNAIPGNRSHTKVTSKSNNKLCSRVLPDAVANEEEINIFSEISSRKLGLNSLLCPPSKNIVTSLLASVVEHPNENNIGHSDSVSEAVLDFMGRMESNKHAREKSIDSENEDQLECSNINPSSTNSNILRERYSTALQMIKRSRLDSLRNDGICLRRLDSDLTEDFNELSKTVKHRLSKCCSHFYSGTCFASPEELSDRDRLKIPQSGTPGYAMLSADILDVMGCIMKNGQQRSLINYNEMLSINEGSSAAITNKDPQFQLKESNFSSNIGQSARITPEEHHQRTEEDASKISDNLNGASNKRAAASFEKTAAILNTTSIKDVIDTTNINETGIPESLNYLLHSVVLGNQKFSKSFTIKA